jgi:hypothetical protein
MSRLENQYRAWESYCRDQAPRAETYLAREVFEWAADECRDEAPEPWPVAARRQSWPLWVDATG